MTGEDAKNWAILIGAVLTPLTTIVLAYFTYRTNKTAKRAEAKADAAQNVAVEAVKLRAEDNL